MDALTKIEKYIADHEDELRALQERILGEWINRYCYDGPDGVPVIAYPDAKEAAEKAGEKILVEQYEAVDYYLAFID